MHMVLHSYVCYLCEQTFQSSEIYDEVEDVLCESCREDTEKG